MLKILIEMENTIYLDEVNKDDLIIVKKNDNIAGFISTNKNGHYALQTDTYTIDIKSFIALESCIKNLAKEGYDCFVI